MPDVIDFPRDIQPILDSLCVNCHGYEKTAAAVRAPGAFILSGDRGPMFSHSYYMLTMARLFSDGRNQAAQQLRPARARVLRQPDLLKLLDGSHYGVKATAAQKKVLRLWIDSARLTRDLRGPGHRHDRRLRRKPAGQDRLGLAHDKGRRGSHRPPLCRLPRRAGPLLPQPFRRTRRFLLAAELDDPRLNTSRHIVFNLTQPEKSILLLGPLSAGAGGWGLCRDPKTRDASSSVFTSRFGSRTIRTLRGHSSAGSSSRPGRESSGLICLASPHASMGPGDETLRILDAGATRTRPMDVYAVEQRYWKSLWDPRPMGKRGEPGSGLLILSRICAPEIHA